MESETLEEIRKSYLKAALGGKRLAVLSLEFTPSTGETERVSSERFLRAHLPRGT